MTKYLVAGLAPALLLTACGQPAPDAALTTEQALDKITSEQIAGHVAYLADDALEGREAGTPGYDKAAAYVAEQFAAMGLAPGGDDGWYQQVPLIRYQVDTDSPLMILDAGGDKQRLVYPDDFVMGGDKLRPETSVSGEVVYVGYGVHAPDFGYSDYAGVDISGKIVAAFSGGPDVIPGDERAFHSSSRVKYAEAVKRGAIGWIALRSRRSQESYPWKRSMETAGTKPGMEWIDRDGSVVDYVPELRGAASISPAASPLLFAHAPLTFEQALDAIEANEVRSAPLGTTVTLARKTHHERFASPNVIGIVPGTDPELADEYVVFTAHLDHVGVGVPVEGSDDTIYNGAYDNAMGIGLILEAARAIAAKPPRRSVMFIGLTAEERGLLGSDYFANYPTVPVDAIVANVNLDMPLFLFPVAELVDFGASHSSLKAPMTAAAIAEGFRLVPDPSPEEAYFRRSDQYSFVRQGIPASYLKTGFGALDPDIDGEALVKDHVKSHYHKPSDDMSRPIDWDSARRFSRSNARLGFAVANADERPQWNEDDFFGERFAKDR